MSVTVQLKNPELLRAQAVIDGRSMHRAGRALQFMIRRMVP